MKKITRQRSMDKFVCEHVWKEYYGFRKEKEDNEVFQCIKY